MNDYNKIKYYSLFFLMCFYNLSSGQYNQSLSCNEDVFCYIDWCNQRRSVVLVEKDVNGIYEEFGTAFLINNAKRDGRPYLLTANHMVDTDKDAIISTEEIEELSKLKFVFNYQHDYCANNTSLPKPSQSEFIIGATVVSHTDEGNIFWGDWILLELNQRIPKEYNSYFNGFSTSDDKPNEVSVIHHPKGDIKKYSYTDKKVKRKDWKWTAKKWTIGTLEGGSSGAPWFNSDKRVIGVQSTITFDENACGNNKIQAGAGRFDVAWDYNSNIEHQLEHWLGGGSITAMSGTDPCPSSYTFLNASDLHTSNNVDISPLPPITGPAAGTRSYDGVYTASGNIEARNNVSIIPSTSVEFYADKIILKAGFHAQNGSHFRAKPEACLGGCGNGKSVTLNDVPEVNEQNNSIIKINSQSGIKLKIYPNPTNGIFNFETNKVFEQGYITIKDVLGKTTYQSSISSKKMTINLSGEPHGLYIVHVNINDEITVFKLILQ